ncbi:MAG: cation:proton antiporter [Candidatus Caldipriscus sp.]
MHAYEITLWVGLLFLSLFLSGFLLKFLKFPYILSFMLMGILGKYIFPEKVIDWVRFLESSAIIFLFFFIGLEYSFERLLGMARVIKPGFIDFFVNSAPVFLLSYLITRDLMLSSLLAVALYPSSTSITAKLLVDYRRLINPEADLLIGILIFEDLVSVIFLALFSSALIGDFSGLNVLKGVLVMGVVIILFYLLRGLAIKSFKYIDRISNELIFPFFIVGILLFLSGFGESLGVSSAIIAFLLGVIVPENSQSFEVIEERLADLKELAIGVFFFSFTFLAHINLQQDWLFIILLFVLITITKFISTYWASRVYGLGKKASFRASFSFLARGEFSVLFASLMPQAQPIVFFVVMLSAILGSLSFIYAPKLSTKLAGK